MSGKHWFTVASLGVVALSALIVGKSMAQVATGSTVDPYNPVVTTIATPTVTPAVTPRPPVRDPVRAPVRSPFAP